MKAIYIGHKASTYTATKGNEQQTFNKLYPVVVEEVFEDFVTANTDMFTVSADDKPGYVKYGTHTFEAAAIGTAVNLVTVPHGCTIYRVTMTNAALGSGVTLDFGYATAESGGVMAADADAFGDDIAATNAATTAWYGSVTVAEEAYIKVTTAGAESTGDISILVEYTI